ncbi:MAG: hypothetical protein JO345_34480 [Streptosporangiaceae bacterium]|nr:hypothetical protein [Streptosporangiaceae bacterium]
MDFDQVRRKYLAQLSGLTGRSTVVYATDWLSGGNASTVSVTFQDMQGLMEVFRDLPGPNLDLILHSPGGSAEAADRLVRYMRSKYSHVRVIVPLAAMSAATMWALSSNEIVMGKHSQLGPIDPQVPIANNLVPASALVRQFQRISDECANDPARLSAWLPTLQQYWPGLLEICTDADELARSLVEQWVSTYMLGSDPSKDSKAKAIADYFANSELHKSHSKAIDRDEASQQGVVITNLEENQDLQDAVLSVHHAFMITLQGPTVKIIENNIGRTFAVQQTAQTITMPAQSFPIPPRFPGQL